MDILENVQHQEEVVKKVGRKKKIIPDEKKITIRLSERDFVRLQKLIDNQNRNRDKSFEIWRRKNDVNPERKTRNKPIEFEIVE